MRSAPTGRTRPEQLRRALDRHRGLVAGGLAAGAVAAGLSAVAPDQEPVAQVVAAARDLPAGTELSDADVVALDLPEAAVPGGAARSADAVRGRVLAGPVRAGEALTDVRLLGTGLLAGGGPDGAVAVPVRVAEPALPLLVQPGDRVDVLATALEGEQAARAVVSDVAVLAVPPAADSPEGSLLVVAAAPGAAARLAAAAVTSRLSVVVRPRRAA
jgi:pilus assembly protein CpaB